MEQQENSTKQRSARRKIAIAGAAGLFAAIGAALGVIAYHQHWLG